jgi:hypothetical protein
MMPAKNLTARSAEVPESLNVQFSAMVSLAVEHWRLTTWMASLNGNGSGAARHAMRKMGDFLAAADLDVVLMNAGQKFDAGMAVMVVDVIEDTALRAGEVLVEEMVSPTVLWRGQVVRAGEVVTRKGVGG